MEKRRMLKMTEIERNMLNRALTDRLNILHGESHQQVLELLEKIDLIKDSKLYMTIEDYDHIMLALNDLRNAYIAAGRSGGGIAKVILRVMRTRYKRVPEEYLEMESEIDI